jgi:hypothetical protein
LNPQQPSLRILGELIRHLIGLDQVPFHPDKGRREGGCSDRSPHADDHPRQPGADKVYASQLL